MGLHNIGAVYDSRAADFAPFQGISAAPTPLDRAWIAEMDASSKKAIFDVYIDSNICIYE